MKIIKQSSVIFMSLAILLFTVSGNLEPVATAKTNEYTGEELFKGIAFGVGGAQKEIPEMWPEEVVKKIDNGETFAIYFGFTRYYLFRKSCSI